METACGQVAREGAGQTGAPTGTFKGGWDRLTHYPKKVWNKQKKNKHGRMERGCSRKRGCPSAGGGVPHWRTHIAKALHVRVWNQQEPRPALPTPRGGCRVCSAFPETGLQSLLPGDRLQGGRGADSGLLGTLNGWASSTVAPGTAAPLGSAIGHERKSGTSFLACFVFSKPKSLKSHCQSIQFLLPEKRHNRPGSRAMGTNKNARSHSVLSCTNQHMARRNQHQHDVGLVPVVAILVSHIFK